MYTTAGRRMASICFLLFVADLHACHPFSWGLPCKGMLHKAVRAWPFLATANAPQQDITAC